MRNDTTNEASSPSHNESHSNNKEILADDQAQSKKAGQTNVVDKNMKLNDKQLEILRPVAKYSLLVSISLVSTFILGLLAGLRGIQETNTILHIISLYTAFDVVVNTICLTFQYSFNDKRFHRYCRKPFKCSQRVFEKVTINQLIKISKKQSYQGTLARALSKSVIDNDQKDNPTQIEIEQAKEVGSG